MVLITNQNLWNYIIIQKTSIWSW